MRVLVLNLVVLLSCPVWAGNLEGDFSEKAQVELNRSLKAEPCFWRLAQPIAVARAYPAEALAVMLTGQRPLPPSPKPAEVVLEGYEIDPALLIVPVGSVLSIHNRDAHEYSCMTQGANAFELSPLKAGQKAQHTFREPGEVNLVCPAYPFMRASILVVESQLVQVLQGPSRFSFNRLDPGTYTVKAFVDGSWRWAQRVDVPKSGTVQLALGPGSGTPPPPRPEPTTDAPEARQPPVAKRPPAKEQPGASGRQPKPALEPAKQAKGTPATPAPRPVIEKPAVKTRPVAEKPAPKPKPVAEKPAPKPKPVAEKPAPKPKPVADKPAHQDEPSFSDVEPEIEIEEE